jgi:hypothetical protein
MKRLQNASCVQREYFRWPVIGCFVVRKQSEQSIELGQSRLSRRHASVFRKLPHTRILVRNKIHLKHYLQEVDKWTHNNGRRDCNVHHTIRFISNTTDWIYIRYEVHTTAKLVQPNVYPCLTRSLSRYYVSLEEKKKVVAE